MKVSLDFHVFDTLDFDLLLCYPLEKLLAPQGSLDEKLRESVFAAATSCLENPMAKPLPKKYPREKMMQGPLFIISEHILLEGAKSSTSEEYYSKVSLYFCEDARSSSHSARSSLFPLVKSTLFSNTIEIQL